MRYLVVLVLLGLAGCQPPQSHVMADGRDCVPIGYSFAPVWVHPDNHSKAC